MKLAELNSLIRNEIKELVEEQGFRKKPICDVTLGRQAQPQFEQFIRGTDLGMKPLERFIEGFGYELIVVPIKKGNGTEEDIFQEYCTKFLVSMNDDLQSYLKNKQTSNKGPRNSADFSKAVKESASEIMDFYGLTNI